MKRQSSNKVTSYVPHSCWWWGNETENNTRLQVLENRKTRRKYERRKKVKLFTWWRYGHETSQYFMFVFFALKCYTLFSAIDLDVNATMKEKKFLRWFHQNKKMIIIVQLAMLTCVHNNIFILIVLHRAEDLVGSVAEKMGFIMWRQNIQRERSCQHSTTFHTLIAEKVERRLLHCTTKYITQWLIVTERVEMFQRNGAVQLFAFFRVELSMQYFFNKKSITCRSSFLRYLQQPLYSLDRVFHIFLSEVWRGRWEVLVKIS